MGSDDAVFAGCRRRDVDLGVAYTAIRGTPGKQEASGVLGEQDAKDLRAFHFNGVFFARFHAEVIQLVPRFLVLEVCLGDGQEHLAWDDE